MVSSLKAHNLKVRMWGTYCTLLSIEKVELGAFEWWQLWTMTPPLLKGFRVTLTDKIKSCQRSASKESRVKEHTDARKRFLKDERVTYSSVPAWWAHGQRSMVGYGPWGHKESDTTASWMQSSWNEEIFYTYFSLFYMTTISLQLLYLILKEPSLIFFIHSKRLWKFFSERWNKC